MLSVRQSKRKWNSSVLLEKHLNKKYAIERIPRADVPGIFLSGVKNRTLHDLSVKCPVF